jgi:hypothetical protein
MRKTVSAESELEGLRGRVEGWRRSPLKSKSMPTELWDAAVVAAAHHGTHRVAKTLGVNSQRLRQQMAEREVQDNRGARVSKSKELVPVQFVELGRLEEMGPCGVAEPVVLEMVAMDGTRLMLRAKDGSASVLAMINAVRGRS